MPKIKARKLKVDIYRLFAEDIDLGIQVGYHRAHKYTDKPDEETLRDAIYEAIMNQLCERFDFD